MNEILEKDVAVDGPVANEGERSSSTFSTGQGPQIGSLERGQRWTVRRKQEAVLRLLGGEPVELLSRELGIEVYRLEAWHEKAMSGIEMSLKERKGDPLQAELDTAMKRIGELTMQVELLEAKMEKSVPLARRRSRR
ncbi:MAG: IS3 family transposase [Candidatus Hydrogenedentes bacterium]|nr:IS3 family transposase [Candidatus Hydrogenedentota bacterium]